MIDPDRASPLSRRPARTPAFVVCGAFALLLASLWVAGEPDPRPADEWTASPAVQPPPTARTTGDVVRTERQAELREPPPDPRWQRIVTELALSGEELAALRGAVASWSDAFDAGCTARLIPSIDASYLTVEFIQDPERTEAAYQRFERTLADTLDERRLRIWEQRALVNDVWPYGARDFPEMTYDRCGGLRMTATFPANEVPEWVRTRWPQLLAGAALAQRAPVRSVRSGASIHRIGRPAQSPK